ncbi:hypothetical protein [Vreelandella utahensis]|uniref:hypothetical protein n=1 Tax=Vreelandella halophila TaxID=86177 RepID=UPI0009869877|nr:hypothetical protein [Halomonas utahensis]
MYWVIDPIKSFLPGEEGEQSRLLVAETPGGPYEDETLWMAGKWAFDVIHHRCFEAVETKDSLEQVIHSNAEELLKLWNGMVDLLNPYLAEGWLQVVDQDTKEPVAELESLTIDLGKTGALYKLESSIWMLDDLYEDWVLQGGEVDFPYDREFVAAYFTLLHVNDSAMGLEMRDSFEPDAYAWATRWREKLDFYQKTERAIQARQERIQRDKAQAMNQSRHARRNEAVRLVTEDWNQRKSEFRSAEKAGQYYADWLAAKGYEYEPRTVTDWIRKFAKDNNIRLK